MVLLLVVVASSGCWERAGADSRRCFFFGLRLVAGMREGVFGVEVNSSTSIDRRALFRSFPRILIRSAMGVPSRELAGELLSVKLAGFRIKTY